MKKALFFILFTILCIVIFPVSGTGKGKCLNRKFYTKLDYEVLATNRIIIKNIQVNNSTETFNFLLDTGSSRSIVSPSLVKHLNVETIKRNSVSDGIGHKELQSTEIALNLNGIEFANIESFVKESSMPDTKCNVDGIIGYNLMKLCCWNFNLADSIIAIANRSNKFEQLGLYYKQYYKHIWGSPYVMSNIGDNFYSSDMLFDLGDNSKITIGNTNDIPKYIKKELPFIRSKGHAVLRAFTTTIDSCKGFEVIQIEKFHFGKNLRRKNLNSENYISNIAGYLDEVGKDDVIGAEILKEYAIVLDGPKRKFYSKIIGSDPGFATIGIGILPTDNDYYVATVWENSSAMEQGVKAGDTILEVNDISIRERKSSSCDLYTAVLNEVSKSDSVYVTLLRDNKLMEKILIKKDLFQ